ncbi:Pimeloyl-ACP methyl ester carboxylesterase [Asanoa hainanensis]|uniref:Pimeloyl-ACP methyl ester carboxylesterase n=1 Tax=Asanoa hainanensis TaxID=560556 RepID=A0A239N0M6_9ACTN|nr:Pimeloyl-ACP methyl ester carboxylesterase [Asanoa hainanensis]
MLSRQSNGTGVPVVLLPPAATRGEVWNAHQVPALVSAGYRVVVANHRGLAPSPAPQGPYRLADVVADAAQLIEDLGQGPCHVVGASLGAFVAQELAAARPELVRSAVLLGTRARTDHYRRSLARALAARARAAGPVTDAEVVAHLGQLFGPLTLGDDRRVSDWMELLKRFPVSGPGPAAQYELTAIPDRRQVLAGIRRPCLVIAFALDLISPPAFGAEVHEVIPHCGWVELAGLGHFGFLERPDAVNAEILRFLAQVDAGAPLLAG